MYVWHEAADSPREPRRVAPGAPVRLRIGTAPIEPGQAVSVEFTVAAAGRAVATGQVTAEWAENQDVNSYWTAWLGPFADGHDVRYRVIGTVRDEPVHTDWVVFTVRPSIHLALLWHQHQPLYRDLTASPDGAYRFPWARLHALRDYYGMAHVVAQYPDVHLTINFSPVLLWQLEDYLHRGASDRVLQLTRTPPSRLTGAEQREILETFFDAHWHNQIYPHHRYRELLELRVQGKRFSTQDLTDLKMWFNLAWFGEEFRTGTVALPDGSSASVRELAEKAAGFTARDIEAMLAAQDKILRSIVPLHRQLQERRQVEVSVSPFYHPILPLLIDSDRATLDRADANRPQLFARPDDAQAQIAAAVEFYRARFGEPPRGLWPSEGAVSENMLPMLVRHGIRWIATDEGVLARSGRYGYPVADPNTLCQPYQALTPAGDGRVSVFFRHRALSDAIGFHYQREDPEVAAQSFVQAVVELARPLQGERDFVVPVILDGENAWGSYPQDGRPFLHALYRALAGHPGIKTVTMSEYLDGNPERRLAPHPPADQMRVYDLFTGSWIDELGSGPGVDLGTWVGEPEENAAWNLLGSVRAAIDRAGATPESRPQAFHAIHAAEGSDWFWWLGSDHQSDADEAFDDLFRSHLGAACQAAGIPPPPALERHIAPHRVIWTSSAPVREMQVGDELLVRTNCPGALAWTLDGWRSLSEVGLTPSGGVMAGPCHYTARLGPFARGGVLAFRFRCAHPGCASEAPCCRGDEWTVQIKEPR